VPRINWVKVDGRALFFREEVNGIDGAVTHVAVALLASLMAKKAQPAFVLMETKST